MPFLYVCVTTLILWDFALNLIDKLCEKISYSTQIGQISRWLVRVINSRFIVFTKYSVMSWCINTINQTSANFNVTMHHCHQSSLSSIEILQLGQCQCCLVIWKLQFSKVIQWASRTDLQKYNFIMKVTP